MPRIALLPLLHLQRKTPRHLRPHLLWMRVNFRLKSLMLCQYGVCVSGSRKTRTGVLTKRRKIFAPSVCTPKRSTRPLLPSIRILRRLNDAKNVEKSARPMWPRSRKMPQTRPATRTALNVGSCKRKCVNRLLSACG